MKPFFFNRCFEKNNLKALIAWSLLNFGERKTLNLVEKLKNLGFMYATQAGISLSLDDLKTPPTKISLISEAEYQTASTKKEYYQGNLTAVEKFQQLIDTWHRTSELLKQDVIENFKSTDILNPVYMMAFSGARGNISQVRQLVGMRGLMADPQGQIIDFPIRSNFREGLTLTEYVISCYGARKGLVDTALRTANSGYLTRRLVDVSQHVIIGWMNCGTTRGISLGNMIVENKIILPLQNRLFGRVLAEDVQPIAIKNQQISLELASKVGKLKESVLVRSPLTCKHKKFLCQFCYGWSLAYGNLVGMGEAVGVLAAQSIGEPGTQLTMRTFHTGGVFSGGVIDEIRAPFNGFVFFNKSLPGKLIRTSYGKIAFFTKKPGEVLFYSSISSNSRIEESPKSSLFLPLDKEESKQKIKFFLPECTILFIRNAGKIYKGQLVAEFSSITDKKNEQIRAEHRVYSEIAGQIFLKKITQFFPSKSKISGGCKEQIDSLWILSGKIYKSAIASPLFLKKGDYLDSTTTINQSLGFTTNIGTISSYLSPKEKQFSEFNLSVPHIEYKNPKKNGMAMSLDKEGVENFKGKPATQIVLKQPLQNLLIKTPYYKRFSYFFSLPVNQVDSRQSADLLFTTSSLKDNIGQFAKNDRLEWSKKPILYQWFPKTYQTKTGGLLLSSKFIIENFSFDKVLFWISEESYEIPYFPVRLGRSSLRHKRKENFSRLERSKGTSKFKGKSKNQKLVFSGYARGWNSREIPLFYTNNRQLRKKPIYLKTSGFFQSIKYLRPFHGNSLQNRINFKTKKNPNYLKKDFFLSFTLHPYFPFDCGTTLYISKSTPYTLSSKINGQVNKYNNFIFLTKKNILQKLSKAREIRAEKKISFAFYRLSFGSLNRPELFHFSNAESLLTPVTFASAVLPELILTSQRARSSKVQDKAKSNGMTNERKKGSGDKTLITSLLTFTPENPFSLGTKKLHNCFFQRLAFFTTKNTNDNTKGFLENPLFLIKRKYQKLNRFPIWSTSLTKQNYKPKEIGYERNNPKINQDPFKQFICLSTPDQSPSLSLNKSSLSKDRFSKKDWTKSEIKKNSSRNSQNKEIQITFLNFYRRVHLKKNNFSNIFNLFPFLCDVRPSNLQVIKIQNWNPKKEKIKSCSSLNTIEKKTVKKVKVKSGWVYFPQDDQKLVKNIIANKLRLQSQEWNKIENIQLNTSEIDEVAFDQQKIFTEYLRLFWTASRYSKVPKEKGLNLNTLNKKVIFVPFLAQIQRVQRGKSSRKNWNQVNEEVPANSKNIKVKFNSPKHNANFTKKLFVTKQVRNSRLALRKVHRAQKNNQILHLKFRLGLSSFFLPKDSYEKKKEERSTIFSDQNKKFNKVIISSRETQEFNLNLVQEKNFLNNYKNINTAKLKDTNVTLSKIKKINPWIKRNFQLIINKKNDPRDTGKISKKLQSFFISSLTNETKRKAKSCINSGNSDFSKMIVSKTKLTQSEKRANLVFFSQLTAKNENSNFKKNLSQKRTQTKKKNSSSDAVSSAANNPYNMFFFGSPRVISAEQQIAYSGSQPLFSAETTGFTSRSKTSKHQRKLVFEGERLLKISKPKILVLFRKIIPYSLLDTRQYKKRVYSSNKKEIFFESLLSSNFTRQKKTKLFSSDPSHDLQIKRLIPLGAQKDAALVTKFLDKIVLQRVNIVASPSINLGLNAISTQIQSTRLTRKGFFSKTFFLSTYTFGAFCVGNIFSKKNLSNSTKETWISTNRPIFLTDYLSPYKGEIAKSHSNSSCIIITNADQITVSTSRLNTLESSEQKNISLNKVKPFAVIGQLIRSGEEIALNKGLLQSGQVIQIETGKITLRIAYPLLLSFGSIFHVQHTSFVEKKDQLFTLFYQIVKTGDIVQGIPKIEQLFEARGPLIEGRGTEERHLFTSGLSARFWRIYLNYSQKFSNKIAVRKSFEEIQQIIVQEVYMVYQEQGVNLAEKHLEIIVRQMTSFVLIVNPGGTRFLPGEILPLSLVEKANNYLLFLDVTSSIYNSPYYAQYVPVLFGITKAALRSEGFISAASFQETTRVLSQAAIEKRKDYLHGLKENVVLGRVIPAGTGFPIWRWKKAVSSLPIREGSPKGKLQSVLSRFDAESLDSLIL
uniref:DNA-directed RNA polymerase subunit beta'' n=1 Tax=Microthamnion kuetzingianum TaxID=34148 RepID=A0A097KNE4_9CHLO|nr:beta'' subunit of RNA polymerase [Microthamnion kuetzingianum]AIT94719.1 beta'' subunit of RNA polymerase [Microthamnion kuetzingianum]